MGAGMTSKRERFNKKLTGVVHGIVEKSKKIRLAFHNKTSRNFSKFLQRYVSAQINLSDVQLHILSLNKISPNIYIPRIQPTKFSQTHLELQTHHLYPTQPRSTSQQPLDGHSEPPPLDPANVYINLILDFRLLPFLSYRTKPLRQINPGLLKCDRYIRSLTRPNGQQVRNTYQTSGRYPICFVLGSLDGLKSRSFSFLSDATNRQAPPPDTHSLPRGEPPFSLDNRPPPLTSSPSSHSINTATPNPIQAASPAINSLADLDSYIDPPATTPADSGRAVDAIEQHKSHRATHSPPTVPDSTRPSLTSEITSAHASASSTPIINALSEAHCHPGDPILPDPPLLNNQYSQQPGNSSNDNLTTSSSDAVTADCSFNKEDLVQASANIITTYPHEFDVAEMAPNLAPDLPHSALQHYADIDNYLNLANTDETEMKKKKNKKKKKKKAKPTSTSDNLVSDPTSSPDNPVLFYV
ncbi:hypothetical protein H4Q26_013819 [Puccinia striiformis f. sp. tritici PST-130]|nr:hypothetical protein H4Q26_013819 [Puccinia striiformis f. sp. tritici PST-130]